MKHNLASRISVSLLIVTNSVALCHAATTDTISTAQSAHVYHYPSLEETSASLKKPALFGSGMGNVELDDVDLYMVEAPGDTAAPDPERDKAFKSFMYGGPTVDKWRPAKCLLSLRAKLNQLAPARDKSHDGMVGDARHRSRKSDHNPWITDASGIGVVSAYDITDSPSTGCDVEKLVQSLLHPIDKVTGRQTTPDSRLKYIIWKGHIYNHQPTDGKPAWARRVYKGSNKHNQHAHISVISSTERYDDSSDWNINIK